MSIKSKIQSLIASINSKTGETDTNLTDAVQTLVDGFGGAKEAKYLTTMSFDSANIQEDLDIDFAEYPALGDITRLFNYANLNGHKISLRNCRFTDCSYLFSSATNMSEASIDFGETKPTNFRSIFYVSGNTLEKVTIIGDTSAVTDWVYAFRHSNVLETIDADLDFSSATALNSVFYQNGTNPRNIRVVPNTVKVDFGTSEANLTNESLVFVANGLDGTVSGKTITFSTTVKNRLSGIIGRIDDDGLFVADENGDTNLSDFITNIKGWSLV